MTERKVGKYFGGGSLLPDRELARRIVEGAAEYVGHGWLQDAIACDEMGCHVAPEDGTAVAWCLLGALGRAASDYGLDPNLQSGATPAGLLAIRAVQDAVGEEEEWIACWSDDPDRTQEEVAGALRAARERLA